MEAWVLCEGEVVGETSDLRMSRAQTGRSIVMQASFSLPLAEAASDLSRMTQQGCLVEIRLLLQDSSVWLFECTESSVSDTHVSFLGVLTPLPAEG